MRFVLKISSVHSVLLSLAFLSFCSLVSKAQERTLETVDECSDWYLSNWEQVDRKFACMAELHMITTSGDSMLVEWFEVKFVDRTSQKSYQFIEIREIYANGERSNIWEKWLKRDDEYFWHVGDYLEKLERVNTKIKNSEGGPAFGVVRTVFKPSVFAYSVISGSALSLQHDGLDSVRKFFRDSVLIEQREEERGISGFFGKKLAGNEIFFDPKSGWMPVFSRGFFRKTLKGETNRSSYGKLYFEAKSKWETVGNDLSVPVAITNIVHRSNPGSHDTSTIEIKAAWSVKGIDRELFSDKSLAEYYDDDGPIVKIRSELESRF